MPLIKKILVANRGEIALRIMRSAREMGIPVVAVYSEADREALHVRFADEAYCIGPPPSAQSYLNIQRLVETAKRCGAEAVHPGYGFLSENAAFAEAVTQAGLVFIGPSAESIRIMGSKLAAKEAVAKFDVPLVPGTKEPIADVAVARKVAGDIGYPVLIKASAGGGGKGMRIVTKAAELEEQMKRAVSEATSAFGDGSVFIEKYITQPRHIEFQVFGDKQGHVVHLFERECSIQRRHQKVIEEAPSSLLDPAMRDAMGRAAVNVALSCNYHNAGTVEFLVDENRKFYFLEMNTRLQVEHPVTEMITGLDLVRLQITVASGEPLPFRQEDVSIRGHAIECRVYAEDPSSNFLPDTGTLHTYRPPQGSGVRVDDGFREGMSIPIFYDPMIAKLSVHAATRDEAIARALRAIDEYTIAGVATTLPFCDFVLRHEAFRSGQFDTRFVERYFTPDLLRSTLTPDELRMAILAASRALEGPTGAPVEPVENGGNAWRKNRLRYGRN
jgi:propionyl-CoA carboxylase alpha chain